MKKAVLLFSCALLWGAAARPQNADHLYVNSLQPGYDYKAASFVIDTARPGYPILRGLLLWAANTVPDDAIQGLTLDETDDFGNPFAQWYNLQPGLPQKALQPKKIIRSIYSKSYYLLAHVIGSLNPINNIPVASTAYVLKLDDNLNLIWSSKIHFNPVTDANSPAVIEYNDIMETSDRNVVLVGRYAASGISQQALQVAKLNQGTGLNIWWLWYSFANYNTNGLSVEEASNRELVITGYGNRTAAGSARELLFARLSSTGTPLLMRLYNAQDGYDMSGGQISRFIDVTGADRYFIHGYISIDGSSPTSDRINRQHLAIDITQGGVINRAVHFGEEGDEETNDHIFTQFITPGSLFIINLTGYTTSYGNVSKAIYSSLVYNSATFTFSINRYDVIKNIYPNYVYDSRTGLEIKYAGAGLFALLLNSSLKQSALGSVNEVTNVFLRNFNPGTNDTTCHNPHMPPLKVITTALKQPAVTRILPPYRIYNEKWDVNSPISKKLDCGSNWRIYPRAAVQGQRTRRRYTGPGDVVPLRTVSQTVENESITQGSMLYPNPAGSEVKFAMKAPSAGNTAPAVINVFNSALQLVQTIRLPYQPIQTLPTAALASGLYILQVRQGNESSMYRFVKD